MASAQRDDTEVRRALASLAEDAKSGANLMEATLAAARAGATTGEWVKPLREVFESSAPPPGCPGGRRGRGRRRNAERRARGGTAHGRGASGGALPAPAARGCFSGLDGHSNGAEQVAVRACDAGFEVVYQGIRLTPEQIVAAAVAETCTASGLSILSGSHMEPVPAVLEGLRDAGAGDVPVIVGGIIPSGDAVRLKEMGVAVFTPKDFGLTEIMGGIVEAIRRAHGLTDAAHGQPGRPTRPRR